MDDPTEPIEPIEPTERKAGRPRLAATDQRHRRLDVYLTDAEWDLVHAAAATVPLRVWARNEVIHAARRVLRAPPRE